MFRKAVVPLILCCAMLVAGAVRAQDDPGIQADRAVQADPTSQQIYDAARAGNLGQAQQMIDRVLHDYPRSAKAHYVAAEVYARSGNLSRARQELDSAQALNPGLSFAKPASVAALEQQLSSGRVPYGVPVRAQTRGSFSWGGLLLVLAGLGLLLMLLRRRSATAGSGYGYPGQPGLYPAANPYPGQYPGVGPYGQAGMGGGAGSGLMGNLATGLAVGAGVAAGEQLVQHVLGSGSPSGVLPAADAGELSNFPPVADPDMGGSDFGLSDNNGSWDDGGGDAFGGDAGGGDLGGGDWT